MRTPAKPIRQVRGPKGIPPSPTEHESMVGPGDLTPPKMEHHNDQSFRLVHNALDILRIEYLKDSEVFKAAADFLAMKFRECCPPPAPPEQTPPTGAFLPHPPSEQSTE